MSRTDTDHEQDASTPETVFLEAPFSPRTTAKHAGDFARLIPVNRSAMLAFHAIAEHMRLDPEWNPHARRFIHVDGLERELSPEWEGSDTQSDKEGHRVRVLSGYYMLNIEILPENPKLGWVLGSGRRDLENGGMDCLLTLEKKKHQVHGRHARLMHNTDNGALMLVVDIGKNVYLNGNERVEGSQRVMGSLSTALSVGLLTYQLEFTQLNETRYREQLRKLWGRLNRADTEPPLSFEVTPSDNHFEYHGFIIQTPFASGSSGVISAGIKLSTGKTVAVKRLRRTPDSIARIQLEVRIYKKIGDHPNLCHLRADIYSGGDEGWMGKSKINDVYLIHSPLARQTFVELTMSQSSYHVRKLAFHDVLNGLAHFHRHGIMHRDIKPTNLMLVSFNPVHAIIIDYGNASTEATSMDHSCGTVAYLAPEIMQLKRADGAGEPYNSRVDIWSMGLSAYQLFFQQSCKWGDGMDHAAHADVFRDLRSRTGTMCDILQSMLTWQSSHRPEADYLLTLPVWSRDAEPSTSRASDICSKDALKRVKH